MKREAILKRTRKSSKSEFDSGMKYPTISEMARDILVVPISTVASESAFSTGDWIRSSDSELVADGEDEGDEVVFQNVYAAFHARSASAPAGPSGSSPATHVLVPSPTMSQVEEDYVDDNSDENDETYVDVEPDEE
ncbi:unnamed protein product [Linum trigynum]|uniref:HAT C-terminal dimerisation domain-containing protein n=1 Tax=Linum trigynum TaxID=586398 RepID=A0AAV2CTG2_9ROSI